MVPRICIVLPNLPTVSETFLEAHVQHLRGEITVVHGFPPTIADRRFGATTLASRAGSFVRRFVSGSTWEDESDRAYMRALTFARPDAVLAEYGTIGVNVKHACRRLNLPLIVHFHGFDAGIFKVLDENRDRYVDMFQQAAAIVAVSHAMRDRLITIGAPADKVHLNPYGVDCSRFQGASPSEAEPVFIAVGRLVPKKAPQLTLNAFSLVHRAHPAARLRMIGDGPLAQSCRDAARELGIESAVTFLGALNHEQVGNEMRSARAFVQHSVLAPDGDREGTPVGIIEAGATGLPVVSTYHEGIPDVVVHGETGLLSAEHDVESMAAHMATLVSNPALAGQMGAAASQRIARDFSMTRSIDSLSAIIAVAVRPGAPASHGQVV